MRNPAAYRIAACLYFGIAALLALALLLAPWVAERPVSFKFYAFALALMAVPLALGFCAECVYRGRYKPSQRLTYFCALPAISLGPLSQSYVVSAVFLLPLIFVAAGWHASRREALIQCGRPGSAQ
jgi:uncharacterized membrane protein YwaF